jgi:antitoxin (DNA-binding transcriptional repressor) of toxin-antitoxin stability system
MLAVMRVDIHEAKAYLSHYLEQVERGEIVVVCRHDKPVAEIRAIAAPRTPGTRIGGLLKRRVTWMPDAFAPLSADEQAEFDGASMFPR